MVIGVDFDWIAEFISPGQLAHVLGVEGRDLQHLHCPRGELHRNNDQAGSFSAFRQDGRTAAKCHVCGLAGSPVTVASIVWGVSLTEAAERLVRELGLSAGSSGGNARPSIVATYDYTDTDGELLFQVVRLRPKGFRQRRPNGDGGWTWNLKGIKERPLFHLPDVIEAVAGSKTIYAVEGERDVEAVALVGGVATCNSGGAGKWWPEHTETLRDADVIVVADQDGPGREHAHSVAASLRGIAASVRVVAPAEGRDAADHLAAGFGLDEFVLVEAAEGTFATFADESWGAHMPLGPADPDPLPVEVLPGWVGAHVESVAEHTQTPPDMALQMALAALATTVAGKGQVEVRGGYREPLNLWTCTLLGPGERKSPVVARMEEPIREYEAEKAREIAPERQKAEDGRDLLEERLKKAKKDAGKARTDETYGEARSAVRELREQIEALEVPSIPRLLASDVTTERLAQLMDENAGRISILSPEGDNFRIMAGRYSKSANFDHYKRGWTGEPIRDDRIGREGTYVRRPALTMGLTIQPSVFQTLEHKESFRGEGLLARFLYAVPLSKMGHRKTGEDVPPLDEGTRAEYSRRLRLLLDAQSADTDEDGEWVPHVLNLSPEAAEVRNDFEAEVEAMLGLGGRLVGVRDWGGKLVGTVTRVAGILHVAERAGEGRSLWAEPVSRRAMDAAISLGRAYVSHALVVFDAMETSPEMTLARYVLRRALLAEDRDNLTVRGLFNLCRGKAEIGTMGALDGPLALLERHQCVRVEDRESTGGRPPSPWVRFNPHLLESIRKRRKSPVLNSNTATSASFADVSDTVSRENNEPDAGKIGIAERTLGANIQPQILGSDATPEERGVEHVCPGCGGGMGEGEERCGSCRYAADERAGMREGAA